MNQRLTHHSVRAVATLATALGVGWLTLGPQPTDPQSTGRIGELLASWHEAGLPAFIDLPFLEFGANIAMFVPVGAVAASWLGSFPRALLAGAACTAFIECYQGLFLPDRVADPRDLLSNTLGAAIGAGAYLLWRRGRPLS